MVDTKGDLMHLTKQALAKFMDHTLLKPESTASDIDRVIEEIGEDRLRHYRTNLKHL